MDHHHVAHLQEVVPQEVRHVITLETGMLMIDIRQVVKESRMQEIHTNPDPTKEVLMVEILTVVTHMLAGILMLAEIHMLQETRTVHHHAVLILLMIMIVLLTENAVLHQLMQHIDGL